MGSLENKYRQDKIKSTRRRYESNIEELFGKCIKWPIILFGLSIVLWGINYVLSNFPIIKHIYFGFGLNVICIGLMFVLLMISGIWASIGIPCYIVKKKKFKLKLEKEIKNIKVSPINDEELLYFSVLEEDKEESIRNFHKHMEKTKRSSNSGFNNSSNSSNSQKTFSYEDEMRDYNRKHFCFVDASGAYRYWGDDFVDTKGNWCRWGTGFYDYAGNYIRWGSTFQDSSGAYRHWGDDFIDGAGNWVKCNF